LLSAIYITDTAILFSHPLRLARWLAGTAGLLHSTILVLHGI
jgi:hypothetical protein